MDAPRSYVPRIETGIPLIDHAWGGFYEGGSYLCYGPANSGRSLLGLMFTHQGVVRHQTCLYVSPTRPRALVIQSEAIGFDLRSSYESGTVRLLRTPPAPTRGHTDEAQLEKALEDFAAIVRAHRPRRVVFDDFRLFTQFSTFEHFASRFSRLLDDLDPLNTTLFLMMGEPTSDAAHRVIACMREQMTGTIHLEVRPLDPVDLPRRLSLLPGNGHLDTHADDFDNLAALAATHRGGPDPAPARPPHSSRPPSPADAVVEASAHRTGDGASVRPAAAQRDLSLPDGLQERAPRPADVAGSTEAVAAPATTTAIQTERQAFAVHLQQHFMRRDLGQARFLLIALRMMGGDDPLERGLYFESIDRHVRQTLQPGDVCFSEPGAERIVVLIPDGQPPDDQRFFARLQKHLTAETPAQATYLMNTVSAIVLPNGRPFTTAEAFMAYAVDAA